MTDEAFRASIEVRVSTLEVEVSQLRARGHDLTEKVVRPVLDQLQEIRKLLQHPLPPADTKTVVTTETKSGENRALTMRDFYIASGCLMAGWLAAHYLH